MYGCAFPDGDTVRRARKKDSGCLRDIAMVDSLPVNTPICHDSESADFECSRWFEDRAFFFLRLTGLTERPSVILQKKVSPWFRLYSIVLNLLSIFFLLQSAMFMFCPQLCFLPTLPFLENIALPQGILIILWNAMCAATRAAISTITLGPGFAESLNSAMAPVISDPSMIVRCRPQKSWLLLSNVVAILLTTLVISANVSMYNQAPPKSSGQLDFRFYFYILESIVFATSWIFGCHFLAMVALGILRRMFNVVASDFEKWARSEGQSTKEFQTALERHTVAWRLTEAFDRVFNLVVGVNFIFSIPMICMITGQTVKILSERHNSPQFLETLWFLVPWNANCMFFMILTCTFASTVNTAAREPRHYIYKMRQGSDNADVLHFLQRLKDNSIGFTFFRFFVIEKTTLLSIFSLTVTYLIVFLQMAQFTSVSTFIPAVRE